jgi:heme oxygenase
MRRKVMEKKKAEQEQTFQEEVQRYIIQNRLQQRVKCSPALYSNGASLASKREEALDRARQQMNKFKSSYDQIKAQIEFNVANRPLLVEQVSKAFIHNLNQIKELQRYVAILREAGMNPDEHLTDE